ncbi:MAG: hypothetical protein GEU75_05590 [Dehalococcoidia bacterium]|nr:hypothetical protein [Dehalococcoidia bacterium]
MSGLGREAGSAAWGIADQALISLANFLTMLLLARSLDPSGFGSFVVVYTVLLFVTSIQMTLITRPHNVLAAGLQADDYGSYTSGALAGQALLALLFTATALLAAGIAFALGAGLAPLLLALAAVVFAWQMQEFARQLQYTRRRADQAFAYDFIRYGGAVSLIALLWHLDSLTSETALHSLALTAGLSALYGLRRLDLRLGSWRPVFRRNWVLVRWTFADCAGQWLSVELYPFLLAALSGVSATGAAKAVQTLVAPSHVVMNAFEAFLVPRAARAVSRGGKKAMLAFLIPIAALAALPLVAFWLLISLLGSQIIGFVYGDAYAGYAPMIWVCVAGYLALYTVQAQSLALLVLGEVKAIFAARVVSVALTLTLGIVFVTQWGAYGAFGGVLVSLAAMSGVLAWRLSKAGEEAIWTSDETTPAGRDRAPGVAI